MTLSHELKDLNGKKMTLSHKLRALNGKVDYGSLMRKMTLGHELRDLNEKEMTWDIDGNNDSGS